MCVMDSPALRTSSCWHGTLRQRDIAHSLRRHKSYRNFNAVLVSKQLHLVSTRPKKNFDAAFVFLPHDACVSVTYAVVRCLSFTFVYCVETAKDTAIVAIECE